MTNSEGLRKLTLTDLLGLKDKEIVWGRLLVYVAAAIAANAIFFIFQAFQPGPMPKEIRLYFYLINILGPIVTGAAAFVGFRFVKKEWGAAAVAALIYVPLILPLRALLNPSFHLDYRIAYSWLWIFLELALLAAAVRLFRSLWIGLAVGSVAPALISGWIQTGIESVIQGRAVFSLGSLLLDAALNVASGLAFATIFWFGLRLSWCLPERLATEAEEFGASAMAEGTPIAEVQSPRKTG